jgi:hypothetical protein
MIEAMACGAPVIAFNRGSVPEVVDEGLTGFIVEDEKGAIGAFDRLWQLSREDIRRQFEKRFTARRMAQEYIEAWPIVTKIISGWLWTAHLRCSRKLPNACGVTSCLPHRGGNSNGSKAGPPVGDRLNSTYRHGSSS